MKSLIAVLLALVASVASASIPDSDGTYTGCYSNANGHMSLIDSSQSCPANTTRVTWTQAAPPLVVKNSNGDVLGTYVTGNTSITMTIGTMFVTVDASGNVQPSSTTQIYYNGEDCTGDAYVEDSTAENCRGTGSVFQPALCKLSEVYAPWGQCVTVEPSAVTANVVSYRSMNGTCYYVGGVSYGPVRKVTRANDCPDIQLPLSVSSSAN